ncbi:Hypothetical predicted protein [Mytilus galloprovincialis]|uniref:Uncharacterized protein n=1 Tax=Mytilus galloprovincialis TaxID=29158 RepID=A0A8B6G4Y7_MYTGA|nr:Hypothetical predicted protein [Mytilus galloprovincialis]
MFQESNSTKEIQMENQECQVQPQPQNWSWSLEESNILIENISYYQRMIETIERAKSLGPVKLPKAPKRKVQDLFKEKLGKKKKQTITTPEELHTFLMSRKADLSKTISRQKFSFNIEGDPVKQLQEAYKHLGRHNAPKVNTTWDTWLSTQIDISIPHARKLRQLSNLLKGFKGFLNINVSINDILSKQELIKQMLEIDQFATFWRKGDFIPWDDGLTPSQEV